MVRWIVVVGMRPGKDAIIGRTRRGPRSRFRRCSTSIVVGMLVRNAVGRRMVAVVAVVVVAIAAAVSMITRRRGKLLQGCRRRTATSGCRRGHDDRDVASPKVDPMDSLIKEERNEVKDFAANIKSTADK